MTGLRISRLGSRDDFHFALDGVVHPPGARSLDRLLLECQARGAASVRLEFEKVGSICALGLSVLARWGRVYEETERRILVSGLSPALRGPLVDAAAVVYEPNDAEAPAPAAAGSDALVPPGRPEAADAELASVQMKLKRKVVEFRNLFEVTQALNLAQDLDEVMQLFGLHAVGQFGLGRLALFLVDGHREGTLSPRHVRGFPPDHFQDFAIPADPFRALAPERAFIPLQELAHSGDSVEGIEALLQSDFDSGVVLRVRRELVGVLFLGGRGGERQLEEDQRDLLTMLAHQAAVAITNARNQKAIEERNLGLVRGMMALIESRDTYAKGSTERVVRYVSAVARLLDYPRPQLKALIYGAVLRDIGMITVSHLIVKNPAHLSEEEWALIKQHPTRGAQILEEMNFPKDVIDVVLRHHERWCGEGYPGGMRGTDIPLGARIVSLVDAYVAMMCERPYRRALPHDKARQVIAENWGTPFDPAIVEAFLGVLDRLERRSKVRAGSVAPGESAPADAPALGPADADGAKETQATLDPLGAGATIPVEVKP